MKNVTTGKWNYYPPLKLPTSIVSGKSSRRKMRNLKSQAKPKQAKPQQAKQRAKHQAKPNQTTPNQSTKKTHPKQLPHPPKKPNHIRRRGKKNSPASINNCCGTNCMQPLPRLSYNL